MMNINRFALRMARNYVKFPIKIRSQHFSQEINGRQRLFNEDINVLYDSKCKLCMKEIEWLTKLDKGGKIKFTDLNDLSYDERSPINGNITYADGMKYMHAVTANGEVLKGVVVFRELYNLVGMGWLYAFTKVPGLGAFAEAVYAVWAKIRTNITRGQSINSIIEERNAAIAEKAKTATHCKENEGYCETKMRG